MLLDKDIKNIWELKNGFTHKWVEPEFISSSLKLFSFSQLSKSVSEVKQKGYSFQWIMTVLLSIPSIGAASVNSMLNGFVRHRIEAGSRLVRIPVEKPFPGLPEITALAVCIKI